ncbi:hypothetical protein MASR2M39_31470 [Ignavibacteriales bacterium]
MIKLHFETLTPLFIGSGDELVENFDFCIRTGVLHKFNQNHVLQKYPNKIKIDETYAGLKSIPELDFFDDTLFWYKIKCEDHFLENFKKKDRDMSFVREFTNVNGSFYVPGSSVKGAITTCLGRELGITSSIKEKFLIRDSEPISKENFTVLNIKEVPPSISMIVMNKNVKFTLLVPKASNLDVKRIEESIKDYSTKQIASCLMEIDQYPKINQNLTELQHLKESLKNLEHSYAEVCKINIGFGGGSWFKVDKGIIPEFRSSTDEKSSEEPDVSYAFNKSQGKLEQLGWCRVEVEEC